MGPGPRFELGRKAPQASMLTKLHHPGHFSMHFLHLGRFDAFRNHVAC